MLRIAPFLGVIPPALHVMVRLHVVVPSIMPLAMLRDVSSVLKQIFYLRWCIRESPAKASTGEWTSDTCHKEDMYMIGGVMYSSEDCHCTATA